MTNLLSGGTKVIPEFTGLQVNTSVQVVPIPIIYGAPRINVNLIYYNGFHTAKVKTGSGKGSLSGGKNSSLEYFATILLAIGEGTIGDTYIIYQNSNVFVPADYPSNGVAFFNGAPGQQPWSVIEANWPADARTYQNTAYYAFYNAQLDSSATVPQIDLVVGGLMAGTCPLYDTTITITSGQYDNTGQNLSFIGDIHLGTLDADPARVIYDFLTNPIYGAMFPPAWVDTTTLFTDPAGLIPGVGDPSVSSFCQAIGLGWSVVLNNAESASSILERWCKNLNVAIVWNGYALQFIPYWDAYSASNPGWSPTNGIPQKYYNPIVNSMVSITMDDVLQSDQKTEDPISFTRKDPMDVYNTVRVDFKDRTNFYNDVPAESKDEVHIELYGPKVDNIGLANEFSLSNYAQMSSLLQLRRNIGIMRTFTWRMSPLWAWLQPMYIVTIPDPVNYANTVVVRIVSVEDDEEDNITVTAEEFSRGVASPTVLPANATTPPNQGATNNPPQAVYPPVILEPTASLETFLGYATPIFIIGVSGGVGGTLDPNWGGANIYISLDGVNYELMGEVDGPSLIGNTTSGLNAYSGANPDVTDSLSVYLGESGGVMANSSPTAAAAGQSICVVMDNAGYEILSYTTATLSTPFQYTLTGLYRGLFGTAARSFAPNAQFLFIGTNANILIGNLPNSYVGQNFFVKAQSFSTFGNITQDLTEVVAYEYFVGGSGAGGSLLMTDSAGSSDSWLLPGQFTKALFDSVVSSDSTTMSVFGSSASISDSTASSDILHP